jgi:periplasmic divalent cation tolerance protein
MTTLVLLHVPCRSVSDAKRIGRVLIEERLAACINIIKDIDSIYRWKGKIEEGSEALLMVKTPSELLKAVTQRIKEIHSDECPCIAAVEVDSINDEYCAWVNESTQQ